MAKKTERRLPSRISISADHAGVARCKPMIPTESLKAYFDRARRFDQDRAMQIERSSRIAWSIASVSAVIAGVAVFAVAGLTPLKTVEPFVVRVDNATGIVDVVSALTSTAGTYDEAVTKYFAAKYVRAREGYVWSEAEENFRTIALLSTQAEQARFSDIYRGSNPQSPQNVYGRAATARITIASISLINENVVSVRYMRTITRGEEARSSHWVATLTYSYANAPMSATDRLVNPLGFAVSDYRADPEAIN
jgi:type IV secretion system protein VirB8